MAFRASCLVALLFAGSCSKEADSVALTTTRAVEPERNDEVLEPCHLESAFDQPLLRYIRANVPTRTEEPNVDRTDPEHPFLLTPWLDRKRLPRTALSAMVNISGVTVPTTIDPSVSKYALYIQRGLLAFGVQPPEPAILAPPLTVDRSTPNDVRNQGGRNSCVAHATLAAMERFSDPTLTVPDDLSEEDAYHEFMLRLSTNCCTNRSVNTMNAPEYLRTHGVPEESFWKYSSAPPGCLTVTICNGVALHQPPTAPTSRYRIAKATMLIRQKNEASITNPAYLEALLETHDIVLGTFFPGIAKTDSEGTVDIWFDGEQPYCPTHGHALLLVGYDHAGQYFIARDSQGSAWGHGGYLHLTYRFIRVYAKYGFFITEIAKDSNA